MSCEEKEILSCHTDLAVGNLFFCDKQHMSKRDLFPVVHSLINECDGMIKEPGIYAFRLTISKRGHACR